MKLYKVGIEDYDNGNIKAAIIGDRDYKGDGPKNTIKRLPGMTVYNCYYKSFEAASKAVETIYKGCIDVLH